MAQIIQFRQPDPKDSKSSSPQQSKRKAIAAIIMVAAIFLGITYFMYQTPSGIYVEGVHQTEPKTIADISFTNETNENISVANNLGKVTLLHFWATWCTPCVAELPSIDKLQDDMEADGLRVLAVSTDDKGFAAIQQFYEKYNILHLPIYMDAPKKAFGLALEGGRPSLPYTLVLNEEGKMVAEVRGAIDWKRKDVRKLLSHYAHPSQKP